MTLCELEDIFLEEVRDSVLSHELPSTVLIGVHQVIEHVQGVIVNLIDGIPAERTPTKHEKMHQEIHGEWRRNRRTPICAQDARQDVQGDDEATSPRETRAISNGPLSDLTEALGCVTCPRSEIIIELIDRQSCGTFLSMGTKNEQITVVENDTVPCCAPNGPELHKSSLYDVP